MSHFRWLIYIIQFTKIKIKKAHLIPKYFINIYGSDLNNLTALGKLTYAHPDKRARESWSRAKI